MNRIESKSKIGIAGNYIKDYLIIPLLKITSIVAIVGMLNACIPSTVEGKTPTKTPTKTKTPTSLVLKATPTPTTETSTNKGITETAETKEVDALRDTVANAIIEFSSDRELKYKYIPRENNMYTDLSPLHRSTFDIQAHSKSIYFTAAGLILDGNNSEDWGWGSEYSARENARAQSIIDGTEKLYEFVKKNADTLSKYYKFDFEPGENGIKMITIDVVGTLPSGGMETIAKYLLATTLDPEKWSIVKTVVNDSDKETWAVYLFDEKKKYYYFNTVRRIVCE